jgi:hypothetical protein
MAWDDNGRSARKGSRNREAIGITSVVGGNLVGVVDEKAYTGFRRKGAKVQQTSLGLRRIE